EGDLEIVAQVGAAFPPFGPGGAAASAEELLENPAASAAEDFPEDVEGIDAPAGGRARAVAEGAVPVAVVGGAFLLVGERLVAFADLLEPLLGGLVIRVLVRMVLHGEAPVGLLDLAPGGVARDFQ